MMTPRRLKQRPSKPPARGGRDAHGGGPSIPIPMLLVFVCIVFVCLPVLIGTWVMSIGGRAHGNPKFFVAQASPQRQEFVSQMRSQPRSQPPTHHVRATATAAAGAAATGPPVAVSSALPIADRSSARASPDRFLTFERYPGRLNNQLLTLDWAFRCARAFNRTVYVAAVAKKLDWVGFPESREEEAHANAGAALSDPPPPPRVQQQRAPSGCLAAAGHAHPT